jgi:hypothetical protein
MGMRAESVLEHVVQFDLDVPLGDLEAAQLDLVVFNTSPGDVA